MSENNPLKPEILEYIRKRLSIDYATHEKLAIVDDVSYLLETALPQLTAALERLERENAGLRAALETVDGHLVKALESVRDGESIGMVLHHVLEAKRAALGQPPGGQALQGGEGE